MSSIAMPWGRHRGVPLDEIETSYLVWVIENATQVAPSLRTAITAELGSRFSSTPPPPRWSHKPCPDPTLASKVVAAGLRTLAKTTHPDHGGDTAEMQRLNATVDWLKTHVVPQ